jgi:hypothetical protein
MTGGRPDVLTLLLAATSLLSATTATAATIRSSNAKADFKREHHCPINGHRYGPCPGYVIDYVVPLSCNGADAPSNMHFLLSPPLGWTCGRVVGEAVRL